MCLRASRDLADCAKEGTVILNFVLIEVMDDWLIILRVFLFSVHAQLVIIHV